MRTEVLAFLIVLLSVEADPTVTNPNAPDPLLGCYRTLTSMSDLAMPGPVPVIELTATPATGQSWYPPGSLVWLAHRDGKIEHPLGFWRRRDGTIQITTSYGFGGEVFELHEDTTGALLGTWSVANDSSADPPRRAAIAMKREDC